MHKTFVIGLDAIASYRRLSYEPWYALAEFVDNATQSFFDNRQALLDAVGGKRKGPPLEVGIVYSRQDDLLRISDNAAGITEEQLDRALQVGVRPSNPMGRCRYGMGMKTAACWLGDKWTVRTKTLGTD